MAPQEEQRLRQEMRELRQRAARSERARNQYRAKSEQLARALHDARQENKKLKGEIEALQATLSSVSAHKDKLAGMMFKTSTKPSGTGRKRGGQVGHPGRGKRRSRPIDQEKTVYLTHCPACDHPVAQSAATYDRTVADIPLARLIVTLYHIQRQWCGICRKEVRAIPPGTIPGLGFGVNFLVFLLTLKYRLRSPLGRIKEFLKAQHQLTVTEGGLQHLLHHLKERFNPQYQRILKEIRNSKVKHADETSWRIEGQNGWCWLFASPQAAFYTIEETRGKGVPEKVLAGSSPGSVLVRDDYGGYEKLPLMHQSCWTHLLRAGRDAAHRPDASTEAAALHQELKGMFGELKTVIDRPFDTQERRAAFARFQEQITAITSRRYAYRDSQAVQTRIRNQHVNLLTAVLHENVPLTNNHAERQIRPMVVTRKISGGSRSPQGAATHAVNMSVMQTIALRGKPFFAELRRLLAAPAHRYALEKIE